MLSHVVAVDWSGARVRPGKKLWLCEVRDGAVVRLASAPSREGLVDDLVALHHAADGPLAIGFDFAFSFPAWAFARTGLASAPEMWALAASRGETWLTGPRWPFWRAGRPDDIPDELRRTEREVGARVKRGPSSVFKLVGGGQVGAGSVRGMALLPRLRDAGMAVWPFDDARPDGTTVVEIWPRLYYHGRVTKAREAARSAYLGAHHPELPDFAREAATRSDDAFDALTSALAMWAHREALGALPPARDDVERLEGRIWDPEGR